MTLKRNSLSKAAFWKLNDGILEEIKKINWSSYTFVHTFLPIKENNEIDTFEVISFFRHNYPTLKIVIPRTDFKNYSMEHIEYDHMHSVLRKNHFNIPEPIYGHSVPVNQIDVVFVPLLAFDKEGNRIGYGGGFYDRFLKDCKKDCLKIGLSLFNIDNRIFESGKYDIKLDMCITPTKSYRF